MTEKIPIVICVCGYEHTLHPDRKTLQLSIVCHSCFRTLLWQDKVPIARKVILESGQQNPSGYERTVLKTKGYVER